MTEAVQAWVRGDEPARGLLLRSLAAESAGASGESHLIRLHPSIPSAHNRSVLLRPQVVLEVEKR